MNYAWHLVPARLCALVLLVAMSLLAGSPRVFGYVCRIDRTTHMSCCCGTHADVAAGDVSQVERRGCCEARSDESNVPAATFRADDRAGTPVIALVRAPDVPEASSVADARPWRARGPPPATGPPLFLRDCRLLI